MGHVSGEGKIANPLGMGQTVAYRQRNLACVAPNCNFAVSLKLARDLRRPSIKPCI
jgi:hypothetical protein